MGVAYPDAAHRITSILTSLILGTITGETVPLAWWKHGLNKTFEGHMFDLALAQVLEPTISGRDPRTPARIK